MEAKIGDIAIFTSSNGTQFPAIISKISKEETVLTVFSDEGMYLLKNIEQGEGFNTWQLKN